MISILMSVYNGEQFLREAMDSVLGQSYADFELLIVDDCSTDKTREIIQSYRDKRIKTIFNEERKGLTYNLVLMHSLASGEYIARLDADDICHPCRLEEQKRYLDSHKECYLVGTYAEAIGDKFGITALPTESDTIKAFMVFMNVFVHSSVMFRNSGNFTYNLDFKKSQDYELWDRMIEARLGMAIIPQALVYYRYHSNQIAKKEGGEQQFFADKVRLRCIERININLDDERKKCYLAFINQKEILSPDDLSVLIDIFSEISDKLSSNELYDSDAINIVIQNYYVIMLDLIESRDIDLFRAQRKKLISRIDKLFYIKHLIARKRKESI